MALDPLFSDQTTDATAGPEAIGAGTFEFYWRGDLPAGARLVLTKDSTPIDPALNVCASSPARTIFTVGAGNVSCELVGADVADAKPGNNKTSVTCGIIPVTG